MWSVRTLARNVGSQYYHRLLQSPKKEAVIAEMQQLTVPLQEDARQFMKDPVVAEFLQLPSNTDFTENELEKAIIKHLRTFLLELGRGFAFMYEQYHIKTDAGDFFIDLVFYNVVLKCYVLIDLKTKKVTHQDVGQMDITDIYAECSYFLGRVYLFMSAWILSTEPVAGLRVMWVT